MVLANLNLDKRKTWVTVYRVIGWLSAHIPRRTTSHFVLPRSDSAPVLGVVPVSPFTSHAFIS